MQTNIQANITTLNKLKHKNKHEWIEIDEIERAREANMNLLNAALSDPDAVLAAVRKKQTWMNENKHEWIQHNKQT